MCDSAAASPLLTSLFQVLFFEDESSRQVLVRLLRQALSDVAQELRVTETREEALLQEALTRDERAQIVETFIRHAFAKVRTAASGVSCSSALRPQATSGCLRSELT